jgi:hypothetical protein
LIEKKGHVVFALRRMCKTTQAREIVARLDGVGPLLSHFFALTVQPLQKSLAGLLQTLATNPEIKVQMAQLGAVQKLVALLTLSQMHMLKLLFALFCFFLSSSFAKRYVICIVRNVACNNDENRILVARAGGIKGCFNQNLVCFFSNFLLFSNLGFLFLFFFSIIFFKTKRLFLFSPGSSCASPSRFSESSAKDCWCAAESGDEPRKPRADFSAGRSCGAD